MGSVETLPTKSFLFWFVALEHDKVSEYIRHLEKYIDPSGAFIIAKETAKGVHHETKGQHIHIACELDVATYNKFHKNIHVEQLKLRRKACPTKGGKQVGRVHNVRDEMKMLSYTCKNENITYKNIDLKTIQLYIENSYPKKEDWDNDIIDYVILHTVNPRNLEEIEDHIIDFYIKNSKKKATLTRAKVKQIALRYLMYHCKMTPEVRQAIKYCL
jgi:hypothetical protein